MKFVFAENSVSDEESVVLVVVALLLFFFLLLFFVLLLVGQRFALQMVKIKLGERKINGNTHVLEQIFDLSVT